MSESLSRTDELLSAYIDGELTEAERAQVEAWLADDPRARSLLEELQGVSAAVKSLPKATLATDLSETILAKVASGTNASDANTRDAGLTLPDRDPQRRFTGRGLWWSAAAIAAAIAVALFAPPQAPQDQAPVARQGAEVKRAGELSAPADPAPPAGRADLAHDHVDFGATEATTTASPSDNAPLVARSDPTPPPPASISDAPAGVAGEESVRTMRAPEPTSEAPSSRAATQYLVVWVDVPAQALERRAIDQVFTSNNIAVEAESDTWQEAAEPVRQHVASRVASSRAQLGFARSGASGIESATVDTPFEAATQIADQGEAILVEATWEQVNETLKQLQADSQNFGNVTIESVAEAPAIEGAESSQLEQLEKQAADVASAPSTAFQMTQEDRERAEGSADPAPTVEPPLAPAPSTDRAIRGVPTEGYAEDSAPAGRYSVEQDQLEIGSAGEPKELQVLGRARRLEVVARDAKRGLRDNISSLPPTGGPGRGGPEGAPTPRQRTQIAQPSTTPYGGETRRTGVQIEDSERPTPVQVLFVLRARPPEVAAEAAPAAPAPSAPPTTPE